jgi:pimeloyl-ACP methyl ester carboxylesterase
MMPRQVCYFDLDGARLQGTYHPAVDGNSGGERLGILFTNAGLLPRSARGDLAARFAETFAEWGYHSFRFDLPGLGDSSGEVPAEILEFYEWVQTGHFAKTTLNLAQAICQKFNLSGIILFGHCGSATTAAFSAMQDKTRLVRGVVLLDPSFILYKAATAAAPRPAVKQNAPAADRKLAVKIQQFRQQLVQTRVGFALKTIWRRTQKLALRARGTVLPSNANIALLNGWQQLASKGMPMLVFHADRGDRVIAFDYLHYLHAKSKGRIKHTSIKGTNHSFVEGPGPETIRTEARAWFTRHFPLRARAAEAMAEQKQRQGASVAA